MRDRQPSSPPRRSVTLAPPSIHNFRPATRPLISSLIVLNRNNNILPPDRRRPTRRSLARRFLRREPAGQPARHVGRDGRWFRFCGRCCAWLERFSEARLEVVLFLGAEDATGEAGEVVALSEEAGYSGEVDDVGSDVEGEGEWEGLHLEIDNEVREW